MYCTTLSTGASNDTNSQNNLSPIEKFFSNCPDNAFQISEKYTVLQRLGSVLKVAPKLFGIGFVAMAVGSCFTHVLSVARSSISTSVGGLPLFLSLFHGFADAFKISLAIGMYLAVSTNLRYQFVSLDTCLPHQPSHSLVLPPVSHSFCLPHPLNPLTPSPSRSPSLTPLPSALPPPKPHIPSSILSASSHTHFPRPPTLSHPPNLFISRCLYQFEVSIRCWNNGSESY